MKSGNADGGKRPQLRANARSNEDGGIGVSLTTPASVQKLQAALHAKAKEAPDFRFYALYDKVYRKDVLAFAYECCKANGGAAGVDGQTFEDIEAYGVERWLDELSQELKNRTYQPLPVRRVYIPKPDGKQRPLGVPTLAAYCTPSNHVWDTFGILLELRTQSRSFSSSTGLSVIQYGIPSLSRRAVVMIPCSIQ